MIHFTVREVLKNRLRIELRKLDKHTVSFRPSQDSEYELTETIENVETIKNDCGLRAIRFKDLYRELAAEVEIDSAEQDAMLR